MSDPFQAELDIRSEPMIRIPLGADYEIIYLQRSGAFAVVEKQLASLLGVCAVPNSILSHASRVAAGAKTSVEDVQTVLSSLRGRGLMVSNS